MMNGFHKQPSAVLPRLVLENTVVGVLTGGVVGIFLRLYFARLEILNFDWSILVFLGMAIGFLSGFERVKLEKLKLEKAVLEKRLEIRTRSLKLEKYRSKELLAHSPDWIFQTNRKFRIVESNKTGPEFLKSPNQEWNKEPFFKIFPSHLQPLILRNLQEARGGKVKLLEIPPHHKSGRTIYLYLVLHPARNEKQEIIGVYGIMRDVTERRELELDLQKAEKMAALGTMAAGVAHELRNPLSVIRTALFNLNRHLTEQDEKTKKHISRIDAKVQDADRTINGLLNYARLGQPELEETDIRRLLDWVLEQVSEQFPGNRVKVDVQSNDIPRIKVDRVQMSEVFQNIIKNAFEAMSGSGELNLAINYLNQEKVLEIRIADTGCGIAPRDLARIGDLFFSTKAGGAGLGLAFSYRIVKDIHRGTINVESKEGRGSVFTVRLPGTSLPGKS